MQYRQTIKFPIYKSEPPLSPELKISKSSKLSEIIPDLQIYPSENQPAKKASSLFSDSIYNSGTSYPFDPIPVQKAKLPTSRPYKIYTAPGLLDNFYYSILDWGAHNLIVVGLSSKIYLFDANTSKISHVFEGNSNVASLKFDASSSYLSAGFDSGDVFVFDLHKNSILRQIPGHLGRVGTCRWNKSIVTTGGIDKIVIHSDIRAPEAFCRFKAHSEEICGLEWDEDTLATGSNDNCIKIWQDFSPLPSAVLTGHTSAIKSMAWSPFDRKVLITGGGANDKKIKVWETFTGKCLHEIDSGSQVCSLMFCKDSKEFVTGHGYERNEIILWNFPELKEKEVFEAHQDRVLYMALAPDGNDLVTGAGDRTLRFWELKRQKDETDMFSDFISNVLR